MLVIDGQSYDPDISWIWMNPILLNCMDPPFDDAYTKFCVFHFLNKLIIGRALSNMHWREIHQIFFRNFNFKASFVNIHWRPTILFREWLLLTEKMFGITYWKKWLFLYVDFPFCEIFWWIWMSFFFLVASVKENMENYSEKLVLKFVDVNHLIIQLKNTY